MYPSYLEAAISGKNRVSSNISLNISPNISKNIPKEPENDECECGCFIDTCKLCNEGFCPSCDGSFAVCEYCSFENNI